MQVNKYVPIRNAIPFLMQIKLEELFIVTIQNKFYQVMLHIFTNHIFLCLRYYTVKFAFEFGCNFEIILKNMDFFFRKNALKIF